jgi:hypothetical protein
MRRHTLRNLAVSDLADSHEAVSLITTSHTKLIGYVRVSARQNSADWPPVRQGGSREKRSRLLRARVILRPNAHGTLDDERRRQHQHQRDCCRRAHTTVERGLRRANEG